MAGSVQTKFDFFFNKNYYILSEISIEYDVYGVIDNNSDNGLATNRRQAIIWTKGDLGYWRTYVSLGLNYRIN